MAGNQRQVVAELIEAGLLDEAPPGEIIARATAVVSGDADAPFGNALLLIAEAGTVFVFDTETIYGNPGEYASIVAGLAKISCGVFEPTEIADSFPDDEDKAFVSMVWQGTEHRLGLKIRSDWADLDGLLTQVNGLLREGGVEQQYFTIDTGNQEAAVVFLTPATKHALESRGVLGFEHPDEAARRGQQFEARVAEQVSTPKFDAQPVGHTEADKLVAEGSLCLNFGLLDRAEASFKKALDLVPDHPGAKAGLAALEDLN
jgi:hypothetical protein